MEALARVEVHVSKGQPGTPADGVAGSGAGEGSAGDPVPGQEATGDTGGTGGRWGWVLPEWASEAEEDPAPRRRRDAQTTWRAKG